MRNHHRLILTLILTLLMTTVALMPGVAAADDAPAGDDAAAAAENAAGGEATDASDPESLPQGEVTVVVDDTGKRLVLIYVIFWLLVGLFAGRTVWQLAKAAESLGGPIPPMERGPSLKVAPEDDPDNPFRKT